MQINMTLSAWGSGLSQLAAFSGLTEHEIADAAKKGAVWCKPAKSHKLRRVRELQGSMSIGDELYLNYNEAVLGQVPQTPALIADEVNYSVWNKPAGMLSQGSKWSDHCTITETVKHLHQKPTFLVHRLDKAAAGLILVAHTNNAVKKLTELFSKRQVVKHYRVQVHGHFNKPLPSRLDANVQEKSALTEVLEADYDQATDMSSLLVSIETGRKHQIRDHLSGGGYPVVGDRLFDPGRHHEHDLSLVACKLAFQCPFTGADKLFDIKKAQGDDTPQATATTETSN